MATITKTVIECDKCKSEIDTGDYSPWVDAQAYGITLHTQCARELNALETIRLLGLDDVRYRGGGLDGKAVAHESLS